MQPNTSNTIDAYIATFPPAVQIILQKIRAAIKKAAPLSEEAMKYGIPTFVQQGNLVHFAAYNNHIGFYPAPSAKEKFKKELAKYAGGKGTVQFPLDQPIPFDLIRRIVTFRVAENMKKVKAKAKK